VHSESLGLAKESMQIESQAIAEIVDYIDKNAFSRAVDALAFAPRIATSGCGHAGIATMKLAHSLCCIERPAKFIPPGEAVHGGLGFVQQGDVAVIASRGGKTTELIPIVDVCNKKRVPVVLVTENLDSPLASACDIVIQMRIARESDRFNVMATASFIVMVAIFDALLVAIMEERSFSLDAFALIHPGGAVGEQLNS
jgi:D-arabinose 5-phosphate isomerase GutQ